LPLSLLGLSLTPCICGTLRDISSPVDLRGASSTGTFCLRSAPLHPLLDDQIIRVVRLQQQRQIINTIISGIPKQKNNKPQLYNSATEFKSRLHL
jgi:hypothetical protein